MSALLIRRWVVSALLMGAAGCANFSADGGMGDVAQRVGAEIGVEPAKIATDADEARVRDRVAAYLANPLTADVAVQIAVINNRGLQARFNELGVSEAQFVEAGLPANPTLAYMRLSGDGLVVMETHISVELLSFLTVPIRRNFAERQFEAAKYRAVEATFRLAADTRRAYWRALAAQHVATYLEQALASADAAAELTRRLAETGGATRLEQARAIALYREVANQVRRARLDAQLTREALTVALGLWGGQTTYRLPTVLPDLPAALQNVEMLEAEAVRRRVDLIAARQDLDATARALGLTRATRFISVLELSGIREVERHDETTRTQGFEIAIQIPIFDLGEVNTRRAQETYMEAVNRFADLAIKVRSDARAAFYSYNTTYDIAREYRDEIVPLRRVIDEEVLFRYNGMLVDVFQLLTTARESIATNVATIQAIRDFYIAETDFRAAVIGGGGAPSAGGLNIEAVAAGGGEAGH